MKPEKYVAFLRGINVGKKKVPMAELRTMCEGMGFSKVKTVLNTGNIIFETAEDNSVRLQHNIEEELEKTFGFHIDTIFRRHEELVSLVQKNPFKTISMTPETRLYVTFLSEKVNPSSSFSHESLDENFTILSVTEDEVYSVLVLSEEKRTTDAMNILEKLFGKRITTRNWNTVVKLSAL